jgi:S-adenosylmethionine hydrolase
LLDKAQILRRVENAALFLPEISGTFHGRDIFAPVAGRLLAGLDPKELGPEENDPVTIQWSEPSHNRDTIEGCIIYIDVFGNLVTNITRAHIDRLGLKKPRVFLCGKEIGEPQPSYAIKSKGEPLAIFDSFGQLEIAVNQGNAAEIYGVGTGDEVIVTH